MKAHRVVRLLAGVIIVATANFAKATDLAFGSIAEFKWILLKHKFVPVIPLKRVDISYETRMITYVCCVSADQDENARAASYTLLVGL